ncbi:oligosaccharide repeat unit polymerase [Priestia flexa]|uniref:O-antigen polymerase n=1 Tax=Priestia flexa TaxID=86664 RepID=UPI001A900423|nr:O-antigen polymerase [Priestia flexa]MBN8433049.1 oligosaccharide repeat unit polymerase [Priestia flexa]MCA0965575.1 oligosaccharide repeat unit polymerase [Priestia flexa]
MLSKFHRKSVLNMSLFTIALFLFFTLLTFKLSSQSQYSNILMLFYLINGFLFYIAFGYKVTVLDLISPNKMLILGLFLFLMLGPYLGNEYFYIQIDFRLLFIMTIGIFSLILGSKVLYLKKNTIKFSIKKTIVSHHWLLISRFLYLIGLLVILYYYISVGNIPILQSNAESFRVEAKMGKGSLLIVAYVFLTVSLAIYQVYCINSNVKIKKIFFVLAVLGLLGLGYRGLPMQLLLDNFLVYLIFSSKKINTFKLIMLLFITFVCVSLIGYFRATGSVNMGFREFIIPTAWLGTVNLTNLNLLFNKFTELGHLYFGKSYFIDLFTILPGYQPNFGTVLKEQFNLNFDGEGISITLLGELLINFGVTGVIVGMFIIGTFLELFFLRIVKYSNDDLYILILILISAKFVRVATGGIAPIFIYYIMPILLLIIGVKFVLIIIFKEGKKTNSEKNFVSN